MYFRGAPHSFYVYKRFMYSRLPKYDTCICWLDGSLMARKRVGDNKTLIYMYVCLPPPASAVTDRFHVENIYLSNRGI